MALFHFKALSDETRLRLMHILLHYELSVNELVRILDMGQSRVSRHLKILTEAGLLVSRRDGLWVFYAAPADGPELEFLHAVTPFINADALMRADLSLAAQMLEERARKTRQFFNAIAENWDELNHEVLDGFDLPEAVCAAVPTGCGTAVDLGCGTGAVLTRLLPLAHKLIGVDGSARMLELCRRRFDAEGQSESLIGNLAGNLDENATANLAESLGESLAENRVSLRIGELDHLPLRDHEADFACINLVLHHLSAPVEGLREVRRILAPAGTLFVADFLRHNDEAMRNRYGDRWLGFDEKELLTGLREAGFEPRACAHQPVGRHLALLLIRAEAR